MNAVVATIPRLRASGNLSGIGHSHCRRAIGDQEYGALAVLCAGSRKARRERFVNVRTAASDQTVDKGAGTRQVLTGGEHGHFSEGVYAG